MGINSLVDNAIGLAKENPLGASLGVGAIAIGSGVVIGSSLGSKGKKKSRRGNKRDRIFKSKQRHERNRKRKRKYKVYGKKGYQSDRKKSSKRRGKIHYAKKTGQPYIILSNGRAKFIKGKRRNR